MRQNKVCIKEDRGYRDVAIHSENGFEWHSCSSEYLYLVKDWKEGTYDNYLLTPQEKEILNLLASTLNKVIDQVAGGKRTTLFSFEWSSTKPYFIEVSDTTCNYPYLMEIPKDNPYVNSLIVLSRAACEVLNSILSEMSLVARSEQ
jgi:hypothetical protein